MGREVLFYSRIVPLDRHAHRTVTLDPGAGRFAFAHGSHVVPAVVDEMVVGGRSLPIVFVPGASSPSPVFLVGLRANRNALIGDDGSWRGDYVPAFIRRYPLIYGEVDGAEPIACVDPTGFADTGEPLFTDDGTETPFLAERLRLMNDYFIAAKRTETFVARLAALDLLRPVTIDAAFRGGDVASLHGLLTIDGAKLEGLADADFLALRTDGFLPAIYAALASLGTLDALRRSIDAALELAPSPVTADEPVDRPRARATSGQGRRTVA